jgi:Ase1/PRC1/MAP65 family protein
MTVGTADLSELLTSMDNRIIEAKEHALSRKDILEKVDKWKLASVEETWLDEYERVPIFFPTSNP